MSALPSSGHNPGEFDQVSTNFNWSHGEAGAEKNIKVGVTYMVLLKTLLRKVN